jgi:hypothetical protein
VRKRRAHKAEIEHFAKLDVVGKLAPAAQQPVFFLARKRGTDPRPAPFFFSSVTILASANLRGQTNVSAFTTRYASAACSASINF